MTESLPRARGLRKYYKNPPLPSPRGAVHSNLHLVCGLVLVEPPPPHLVRVWLLALLDVEHFRVGRCSVFCYMYTMGRGAHQPNLVVRYVRASNVGQNLIPSHPARPCIGFRNDLRGNRSQLALSMDGKMVATASSRGTLLRVFDTDSGVLLHVRLE